MNNQHTLFYLLFTVSVIYIQNTKSTTYYVDPTNSIQNGNGRSWVNAFTNLDTALLTAVKLVDEIWLKGPHTYIPSTTDRSNCFSAPLQATIFGGFIGTESTINERPSINVEQYESIISGDINTNSDHSDNCYHVLTYNKILTLDRITIMHGYANGNNAATANPIHNYGGALITADSTKRTELYLTDVRFVNNTAVNGGALWFESTDRNSVQVMITNCVFQYNKAIDALYEGGYGGAIYLYFLSNITITNTKFVSNHAHYRGGAIYQDYGGIFTCDYCTFTDNSAAYGGAIFGEDRNSQTEGTFPVIKSSLLNFNKANIYGGSICWFNGVIGTLMNNDFDSNEAENGGAIAIINSDINGDVINNNIFNGNIANNDITTRKIYNESYFGFDGIDLSIKNSIFIDIISYMEDIYNTFEQLSSSIIDLYPYSTFNDICYVDIDNANSVQSGASWNSAYNNIQDCIDKLSVFSSGGEIWVRKGIYNPTKLPLWKQKIGKNGPQSYSFIMAPFIRVYGGFEGSETFRAERNFKLNPTFLSCNLGANIYCNQIVQSADNCLIDGFIFIEAQYNDNTRRRLANSISVEEILSSTAGQSGSGIYSNSTTINAVNSIFYALFSSGKGGAVYCIGQEGNQIDNIKSPKFVNVAFIKNRANVRGGAISADVSCNFICEYCKFDGNSCAKKGGAIYLDFYSNPTILYSTFTNNYALESGGCLAGDGKSITTFVDTHFTNNYANWEGGCLYSGSGVSKGLQQGFIFYEYDINTFTNNYLLNSGLGQNDIYGWPFTTIDFKTEDYNLQQNTPSPIQLSYNISAPNFIIFSVDDLSYIQDWAAYAPGINLKGKEVSYLDIPLPNIAEFITESIVFPRSYAGGPKCSPSRFSLITGRYVIKNKYAIDKTLKTASGFFGINVTIQTSKLLLEDGIYNIPYQLQNDAKNPYYTGFVGKWHLMSAEDNGYNLGCHALNKHADPILYDKCVDIIKTQGWNFVDGFYDANIDTNPTEFSHNPEWMVHVATKFMDEALFRNQPFFLYFAHTLTHEPAAEEALFNFNITDTPKGILTTNDIPGNITMDTRANIWQRALDLGFSASNRINFAALDIWMDESFGALITYLKKKGIYDETFVVIMNDHGMGAKGVLYEQGSRILQIVRFPTLFGKTGRVLDNFVTSNVDLAPVFFELSGITLDENYTLDGKNWINDVMIAINGETSDPDCCQWRHIDVYNSHAIVSKQWKYIYRATSKIEPDGNPAALYQNSLAIQQLYDLISDPNEQINQIDNASLSIVIATMQKQMLEYIQNDMCQPLNIICKTPEITFTLSPTNAPTRIITEITQSTSIIDNNTNKGKIQFNTRSIIAIVVVVILILLIMVMAGVYYYKKVYIFKQSTLSSDKKAQLSPKGTRKDVLTPTGKMTQLNPKASKKMRFSPHTDQNSLDFPNIELGTSSNQQMNPKTEQ